MAMNVAQQPENKEKVQLSFSAYRTIRKHLYLLRRHLSLLIRDYINGNTHLQADVTRAKFSKGLFACSILFRLKKKFRRNG